MTPQREANLDPVSEMLMRSTLHDLANTLSGIQGILELNDPSLPLTTRNRARLGAILAEGLATLERARHLAMDTLPNAGLEDGPSWRASLEHALGPLSLLFRCDFSLEYQGPPDLDLWPGELARAFTLTLTRQLLPYIQDAQLKLVFDANEVEWRIRWSPITLLPEELLDPRAERSRDVAAHLATRIGQALSCHLDFDPDQMQVSICIPKIAR